MCRVIYSEAELILCINTTFSISAAVVQIKLSHYARHLQDAVSALMYRYETILGFPLAIRSLPWLRKFPLALNCFVIRSSRVDS